MKQATHRREMRMQVLKRHESKIEDVASNRQELSKVVPGVAA